MRQGRWVEGEVLLVHTSAHACASDSEHASDYQKLQGSRRGMSFSLFASA